MNLKLSDFDYLLPKELIAQYPLKERDAARLMVLNRKDASIEHRIFRDIADYLREGDLLVLNDTKVLPSRLIGSRSTGGKAEVLLIKRKSGLTFDALIKPSRLKLKERILFNSGKIFGELTAKGEITFSGQDADEIYRLGVMPLPPYIKRPSEDLDSNYYQTIYARNEGAVASPTAGLHFTAGLLYSLRQHHINLAYLTLHVGYGTFKPVKIDDITQHKMEQEYFRITDEALSLIEKSRLEKRRIFAVGTTSCRALEAYALGAKEGYTDLFIYPGYEFKIVDCLLTNFHLPRSTLYILARAFAGEKLIKKAYQEAIEKRYRFYSYGDAMLII